MKKLIAGAILLGASSMAFAQPGCGVGAMIWKGQSGIAPHVLAATTNGTFGNQTFGMTTGTLGCQTNQSVQSMAMYMDSNIDKVARDMSRGSGENLDTLAVLLGVEETDRDTFRKVLQDNFASIFPNADTTSGEAVDAIVALLEQNDALSKYVAAGSLATMEQNGAMDGAQTPEPLIRKHQLHGLYPPYRAGRFMA
ncbi:DUF3015 domain-containing protein, partial [Marinobacter sp.]